MKKKILLYNPKTQKEPGGVRSPPTALLMLASLLKDYDVKIFDRMIDEKAHNKLIKELDNNVLCVGATMWIGYSIIDCLELFKKVKKVSKIVTVVGSWQPSLFPIQTVKHPLIDVIVKGQGEQTFYELIKNLDKKKSMKNIKGLAYKNKKGIFNNPNRKRTPIEDLPSLPWHLVNLNKYINNKYFYNNRSTGRTIGYNTSLGCPSDCFFCADSEVYKRIRDDFSAERVLKDIEMFIEDYGCTGIWFDDNNFFINKKKLLKICKGIINKGWNIKWRGLERANHFLTFSDEELKLIKDSGCSVIDIGAESGSQRILNMINKGIKVEDTINVSKLCKKLKIAVIYNFMVGFPEESIEDLKQTLGLIKKVFNSSNELRFSQFLPYPKTRLYDDIVKKGLLKPLKFLEEWASFNTIKNPWFSKEQKDMVSNFWFYLQIAYPKERFKRERMKGLNGLFMKLLRIPAWLRINLNILSFPFEKRLYDKIKNMRAKKIDKKFGMEKAEERELYNERYEVF